MLTPGLRTELLAPAGDRASLEAAVRNGADAVYFGARAFNARSRAGNFDAAGVREAVDFARLRSVRTYLALNTLLHDEELDGAVDLAVEAYEAGIDAVIVQDFGLARRLRAALPDLPLHASTQTTLHDANGIRAACALGFTRVILPRELSVVEIAALTKVAKECGADTEVFVHGALCTCYSGQCRMSSLIGGRSGNRGECAQPCRLGYRLETGGASSAEAEPYPLLSPKDASALRLLPELSAAGVAAFKIEGRMRSAEYVGQVVSVYRRRIDAMNMDPETEASDTRRLLLAFNRGGAFTDAYLRGEKDKSMLAGAMAGSHGILLGTVSRVSPGQGVLEIRLASSNPDLPGPGDVLSVRIPGTGEERASAPCALARPPSEEGSPTILAVKGFHPDVLRTMVEGDPVHRMNDVASEREAKVSDCRKTAVRATFSKTPDGRFEVSMEALGNREASGVPSGIRTSATEETLRDDSVPPIDEARLREQLGKAGGTPFRVDETLLLDTPNLPVSAVNALRRRALDDLAEALRSSFRRARTAIPQAAPGTTIAPRSSLGDVSDPDSGSRVWTVAVEPYVFDGDAADTACGADAYYLPAIAWLSPSGLARIRRLHELEPEAALFASLPPAARGAFARRLAELPRIVVEAGGQGVVTGNPGTTASASTLGLSPVAGPDANLWNAEAVSVFAAFGSTVAVPSTELDPPHTADLCRAAVVAGLEAEPVVYGRQRLMYNELCPVGHNRPGCTLCRNGPVSLSDRTGASFPVVCLPESCSGQILNSSLLSIPREALVYRASGARRLRLCFYDETPDERRRLTDLHRTLRTPEEAERIRSETAAIAHRVGSRLTRGSQ